MEGPHIKVDLLKEHQFSIRPEDGGFGYMLKEVVKTGTALADTLKEVSENKEQQAILFKALQDVGRNWQDFHESVNAENEVVIKTFQELVVSWGMLTSEERQKQAENFGKLVHQSLL